MLDITHFFQAQPVPRHPLSMLVHAVTDALRPRPFSGVEDQKLSDHHWAAQSALLRATRLQDAARIADLLTLNNAIEREMRRRHLL